MFNRVTVLRRLDPAAAPELAERIIRFYRDRPDGGPYLVNDPWATLDLEPFGFQRWMTLPFMVREPGGTAETLSGLEIRAVRSTSEVGMFVRALVEGFGILELTNLPPPRIMDERVLADGAMRCWIAFADGQPVGTSVAYVSDGVVGVYLVSVAPSARRQGFGEALTWHATLADSASPSTLQASELGRPVYERMGYVTALECATWVRTVRDDTR
jgi:GNAT superfamily N-acetyltransferase